MYAIIDTATRVIRGLTTDPTITIGSTESLVKLDTAIDLAPIGQTSFWKLDGNNQKVPATLAEIDASGVDEKLEEGKLEIRKQTYLSSLEILTNDGSLPANLKNYFTALLDYEKN